MHRSASYPSASRALQSIGIKHNRSFTRSTLMSLLSDSAGRGHDSQGGDLDVLALPTASHDDFPSIARNKAREIECKESLRLHLMLQRVESVRNCKHVHHLPCIPLCGVSEASTPARSSKLAFVTSPRQSHRRADSADFSHHNESTCKLFLNGINALHLCPNS